MNRFDWKEVVTKVKFAQFRKGSIDEKSDKVFSGTIDVGDWNSRIEVHSSNVSEAGEFRDWVLKAIKAQIEKDEAA